MTPKQQKISIILLIIGIIISAMILIPLAFFHDEQQKKPDSWMDEFVKGSEYMIKKIVDMN